MTNVERRVGTCPNCHGLGILYETCWKCGTMHYDFPLVDEFGHEIIDTNIINDEKKVCNNDFVSVQCSVVPVPLYEVLKAQCLNREDNITNTTSMSSGIAPTPSIRCHYTNKKFVAKDVLKLTGRIWGRWINPKLKNIREPNDENNMMYDIARCHECYDYGLWGDLCRNCEENKNTYLEILAECLKCGNRGPLGNTCEACHNRNEKGWFNKLLRAIDPKDVGSGVLFLKINMQDQIS